MFRRILVFLIFIILVSARRFGINVNPDIRYGERWERRNNKSNLPSSGINSDGPYGRYRGRSLELVEAEQKPIQTPLMEKMLKINRKSMKRQQQRSLNPISESQSSLSARSYDSFSSRSYSRPSYSSPSFSSRSYSRPSYSTPSYSTWSYTYHGYYRPYQNQQRSSSVNDLLSGEFRRDVMNLSDPNASFSNPNLNLANFS